MRRVPILEIGVALATALSIAMLGLLLAAPWLPRPGSAQPAPTASVVPSAGPEAIVPPVGLYLSRTPLSFRTCFAIELDPRSYPVASDAPPGVASVQWWEVGFTGCDTRSGEIGQVDAAVTRIPSEEPDGPVGYNLAFRLPLPGAAVESDVRIAILPPHESDPSLLQALEVGASGAGLVLDRVPAVDPPPNPVQSGG